MKISKELYDYIDYSIKKQFLLKIDWILNLITYIVDKEYDDEFVKIENNKFYVKQDDELVLISSDYKNPVLTLQDTLVIDKDFITNVSNTIETTFGRVFMNYIIFVYCFNNKISYINEMFTLEDIEDNYIIKSLVNNNDENADIKITIDEYLNFLDIRTYIDSLSNYTTIGASEYNIVKAPGIDEFREKTILELKKKHGEKALEDLVVLKELETRLIEYDKAYIEKDPSYGKLITKKVTDMSRKRMFAMYGKGNDLSGEAIPVISPLAQGLSKNPDELHSLYNDAIGGSAKRGNETKDMGVITKFLIRATADISIKDTDCGSEIYISETITKEHIGKTILDKGKLIILTNDNIETYIKKEFKIRDVLFCKLENNICTTCLGKKYTDYTKAIPLMATEVGGKFLNESLKKFHGTELKITRISLDDLI